MELVCWVGPTILARYINSHRQLAKEALGRRRSYFPLAGLTEARPLGDLCLMTLVRFMGRLPAEGRDRLERYTN